jgi:N-acetylneuraminic acid mutarotase
MNALSERFYPARFYTARAVAALLFCGTACLTVTGTLPAYFRPEALAKISHPAAAGLTFAERVAYQRAIEDVYWRHRIWPKERLDPKPSLDAVMSQAQLKNKVTDYLRDSLALEDYWQKPIIAEQLQTEMDRMARDTKQPEVLRELFEALGNDPAVIAECLARPILTERLIADFSAQDQTHHVESPQVRAMSVATTFGQVVYTLPKIADAGDPSCLDEWAATTTSNVPYGRSVHTAVWTGSEMIVWGACCPGQNTGGRYDPTTDSWTATSLTNAPSARWGHTAVWTGREMIVWGGLDASGVTPLNTGGRYNPGTDSWIAISLTNAPSGRVRHTTVWTGSEMIVWGGEEKGFSRVHSGGRYNPSTNSWRATSTTNAPAARARHTAVWTGTEMIIWAGFDNSTTPLNTGGRYNPSTNTWRATSTTNAPNPRWNHTAIWTGSEMIAWGGRGGSNVGRTGGRYNPSTNSWRATSTTNAPYKSEHTAVWTDSEMIVWGGVGYYGLENTGGRYDPDMNSWTATSLTNAPSARYLHTAVWTGSEMIVWGGQNVNQFYLNSGGRYCVMGLPAQLGNISTRAFVQTGDNVVIGGFIVQGSEPKKVIIRAIGPELTQYGVPNALANPTLELHDATGALIASNNNWATTIIGGIITANQFHDIVTSGYAPGNGFESAIVADLAPGNYTAIVRGVNDTTGVGLVEVYDISADTNSILGNISTRAFVQTGDNVMIGGFIVQGTQPKRVIVRAIGSELTQYGVPDVLINPTLELHEGTGALIASNDNWMTTIIGGIITSNQVADIRNSGHAPADGRESAIIADLPAGNYTAIVRGVNNTSGVALVEVYDLD